MSDVKTTYTPVKQTYQWKMHYLKMLIPFENGDFSLHSIAMLVYRRVEELAGCIMLC